MKTRCLFDGRPMHCWLTGELFCCGQSWLWLAASCIKYRCLYMFIRFQTGPMPRAHLTHKVKRYTWKCAAKTFRQLFMCFVCNYKQLLMLSVKGKWPIDCMHTPKSFSIHDDYLSIIYICNPHTTCFYVQCTFSPHGAPLRCCHLTLWEGSVCGPQTGRRVFGWGRGACLWLKVTPPACCHFMVALKEVGSFQSCGHRYWIKVMTCDFITNPNPTWLKETPTFTQRHAHSKTQHRYNCKGQQLVIFHWQK